MRIVATFMVLFASLVTLNCNARERQMNDTKTYCIGRYLVDLPADAQINGQAYDYKYGQVTSRSMDEDEFQRQMAQREGELQAGKHRDGYKLKNVLRLTPTALIFELERQLLMGPSVGFEAHMWIDNQAFQLIQVDTRQGKYAVVISTVKAEVFPRLRGRHAHELPTEPGFCLKDGFIADDGTTPQFEDAAITFKFAQWPGVLVSIETTTVTKPGEPALLQRVDSSGVWETFKDVVSQIRTLRRGQRAINGRAGEEILLTLPTDGGYRLHQFHWEAQGTEVGNGLKPTLTVELESGMKRENGVPARPRLTDAQAIELFDAVANSVRPRPVIAAKVSEDQIAPTAPLGTLGQTGTTCPQTGWWTCPEATANEIESPPAATPG
ncbi:hypothetical protein LMG24076_03335 [Trinickia soli]|nr:hypothetical protein LMG24076_03335 [Trinickia soli]